MSESTPDTEKVNILLVDDRPGNLISLKGVLEQPDYEVMLAASGPEALRLVLRHEFAVILLDVAMPEMDGFEVAATLKQREKFRSVPIIFVTASIQHVEWVFHAYNVGAVDFLQKPLDPHAVRAKVAVFVELFRQKQQLRRQALLLQESERRARQLEVDRLKLDSERSYRNLADAIPHVVWTADADGQIRSFNRRWSVVTGLAAADCLDARWRSALHPQDAQLLAERWPAGVQAQTEFEIECRLRAPDGTYRWHLCRALPEHGVDGRMVRWLGTFTDVDEPKRAHDEAQAAVRLRDEFISIASHELRTPLTGLRLHLEGLQRQLQKAQVEALNGRFSGRVSGAVRQVDRLSALVDSLLDVSRISSGRMDLHREEFDLADAAHEVVDRFRCEAERSSCELRFEAGEPIVGRWDRLRIEQVISNLLSNAVKYAREKPVEVSIRRAEGAARIAVRDHGIGIQPGDSERIFARFERGVSARNYGGLGLGLYIAGQIVAAHAGAIEVSATPGGGATFTVSLPVSAPTQPEAAPAAGH